MLLRLPGRSIKTQLITLFFGLTAIVIIVIGVLAVQAVAQSGERAGQVSGSAMTDRVKRFLVQAVDASASQNSLLFKSIEQKTSSASATTQTILQNPAKFSHNGWSFDKEVVRMPSGAYGNSKDEPSSVFLPSAPAVPSAVKRELEITSYLDHIFPPVLANTPDAVALYYTGASNTTRYYPNIGLAEFVQPDFDVTKENFFLVAAPQNDPDKTVKWTSVYDDPAGNGLTITASHPIYLDNGAFAGVIGMDITLNNIAKNIEDYSPIESSYALLIDNQGRAIALPDQGYRDILGRDPKKGEFGSDLKDVKGDFGPVLRSMREGHSGFATARSKDVGLYVAYAPIEGTGFSLAIVARQAAMLKVVSDLQAQLQTTVWQFLAYQVLPITLLLLIVVWAIGFSYIRLLTRPITSLMAQTSKVAEGNFNVEPVATNVNNEISQFASSFNDMVADLRASRQKIDEQTKELLHTEQTRLKASINSLNIGFIMTGTDNEIVMLNGVARQILAYEDPVAGTTAHPRDTWTTEEVDAEFGTAINFKAGAERVLRTGAAVEQSEVDFRGHILRIFMAPIRENTQSLGVVVLIEDITAVKALERSKDEFFSIASHELRTPLTAVRGNAALLHQLFSDQVKSTDFDEMVSDIHDASVRLIEIVNDFLDASRLEQGKIQFENVAFPISEILEAVTNEITVVAKEKGNQIILAPGATNQPNIFADKNRVKQIIYNLMGNAMKFTENGSITLDSHVEGQMLKTTITDTGPGISEDGQRLLFRKFQQVGTGMLTRDNTRGTGLGLYISKLLSEQMGGRIALERSAVGQGTTFSFTLPLAAGGNGQPESRPEPQPEPPAKPVKVKTVRVKKN